MLVVDTKHFWWVIYFMVRSTDFKNMKSLCQKYINMEGCGYSWALGIEKALKNQI